MMVSLSKLIKAVGPIKMQWTSETGRAFQALKEVLCLQPAVVRTLDFNKCFLVQTDASAVALEAVLLWEERNYQVSAREA